MPLRSGAVLPPTRIADEPGPNAPMAARCRLEAQVLPTRLEGLWQGIRNALSFSL